MCPSKNQGFSDGVSVRFCQGNGIRLWMGCSVSGTDCLWEALGFVDTSFQHAGCHNGTFGIVQWMLCTALCTGCPYALSDLCWNLIFRRDLRCHADFLGHRSPTGTSLSGQQIAAMSVQSQYQCRVSVQDSTAICVYCTCVLGFEKNSGNARFHGV